MINIEFTEPEDEEWKAWRHNCDEATAALVNDVANNKDIKISDLYKRTRDVYFDRNGPFYGKCAYCESLIQNNQPGDVDHFRPKGRVTDEGNRPIEIDDGNGNKISHPGYYWLAYYWKNLLPACADCNRARKHPVSGEKMLFGKWDKFPVRDYRATGPGDEDKEEALLLNPVLDNPEKHLEFDETGVFIPISEEGRKCIEIFGLNERMLLVQDRRSMYNDIKDKIIGLASALNDSSPRVPEKIAELLEVKTGKRPYAAAGRAALKDGKSTLSPLLNLLGVSS